jgi:hypothetical protein
LRYNYALNVGHFTQKRDDFYWADKRTTDKVSFNKIIEDFCQTNNLQGWIHHYTKIRNEIVHQGEVIGNNSMEKIKNYLEIHHFCDRVILAILNWDQVSGYYIPINGVADFGYDFYLLAIAKLLHGQYFRLLDFYFHTLIQQRPINQQTINITGKQVNRIKFTR